MNRLYELDRAGVRFGHSEVLKSVSLQMAAGESIAVAGPNGAGKSTLLSLLAGLLIPSSGTCRLLGRSATDWRRADFAQRVAVVQQEERPAFPFTAAEVVAMGRMPYRSGLYESAEDHKAIAQALQQAGAEQFRDRDFSSLSGGEKQRVLIASALAQAPDVLLLDEPATHLDLRHQISLHRLLRELSRQGMLVVCVTHDLNLAAAYATRLILMEAGCVRTDGVPREVLSAHLIEDVFRIPVELHRRASGRPWFLYGD